MMNEDWIRLTDQNDDCKKLDLNSNLQTFVEALQLLKLA